MKINNGDLPVTPIVNDNGHPYHASQVAFDNTPLTSGLSKREHFAAMAMQGMASHPDFYGCYPKFADNIAGDAVKFADALLKELAK